MEEKVPKLIIMDTSVYGELIKEPEMAGRIGKLEETHYYVFYGNDIIRKELRDTPKQEKIRNKKDIKRAYKQPYWR